LSFFIGDHAVFVNALNLLKSLIAKEEGVTAIEYGLMAALIAVVIIGGVTIVGTELTNTFTTIQMELANVNAS
jgi:pilus assembly protein Flp/PilA